MPRKRDEPTYASEKRKAREHAILEYQISKQRKPTAPTCRVCGAELTERGICTGCHAVQGHTETE